MQGREPRQPSEVICAEAPPRSPAPGRPCSGKSSDLESAVSEPLSTLSHTMCDLEKVNSPGAFVPCTASGNSNIDGRRVLDG